MLGLNIIVIFGLVGLGLVGLVWYVWLLLSGFFQLRGGTPSIPLTFFRQNNFPLRGKGVPPIPLRKNYAKKQAL